MHRAIPRRRRVAIPVPVAGLRCGDQVLSETPGAGNYALEEKLGLSEDVPGVVRAGADNCYCPGHVDRSLVLRAASRLRRFGLPACLAASRKPALLPLPRQADGPD